MFLHSKRRSHAHHNRRFFLTLLYRLKFGYGFGIIFGYVGKGKWAINLTIQTLPFPSTKLKKFLQ